MWNISISACCKKYFISLLVDLLSCIKQWYLNVIYFKEGQELKYFLLEAAHWNRLKNVPNWNWSKGFFYVICVMMLLMMSWYPIPYLVSKMSGLKLNRLVNTGIRGAIHHLRCHPPTRHPDVHLHIRTWNLWTSFQLSIQMWCDAHLNQLHETNVSPSKFIINKYYSCFT